MYFKGETMSVKIGITTLLDNPIKDEIYKFWNMFESQYKSTGVQSFAYPNLGFQGGLCESIEPICQAIENYMWFIEPPEIIVNGFGYFEEPSKVVFLKVQKSEALQKVHEEINEILQRDCCELFEFYKPKLWTPHITLAMDDLQDNDFFKFREENQGIDVSFKQVISNLVLVEFTLDGKVRLIRRWEMNAFQGRH
jgi:2'-5' RNA ligase